MVRGPKIEDIKPGRDYQALTVVTDVRVVFLVGTGTGDVARTVSHDEIVTIRADSEEMFKRKLQMETVDDDRWTFYIRGDASEVADYIDDAAQTWTNASRLVDGARRALDVRATELRERLPQLRREIAAMVGAHNHPRPKPSGRTNTTSKLRHASTTRPSQSTNAHLRRTGPDPSLPHSPPALKVLFGSARFSGPPRWQTPKVQERSRWRPLTQRRPPRSGWRLWAVIGRLSLSTGGGV